MNNKKTYLFLLSIGPVQSFIAQARKTQDLYAGSKILSDLAQAGLSAANPKEMIFPNNKSMSSAPNRFLCVIESEKPQAFGQSIVAAIEVKWHEIAAPILKYTNIKGVIEQIESHLDINWVYQEIQPDYSDYDEQYKKIERLLGAVKNARQFQQFTYQDELGEKGRKCSVDGERNVKFYRLNEKEKEENVLKRKLFVGANDVEIIAFNTDPRFPHSKLQAGEGLSAVSMTKRCFAPKKKTAKSTSDIALQETFNRLEKHSKAKELINAIKFVGNSQLFYKENNTETYYKTQGLDLNLLEDVSSKQQELEKLAKKQGLSLTKYYAIIDFDGDNMGKWLSGENIDNPDINLKKFHEELSKKLALFAKEAESIVDNYGQTVYAGGDDFLGFVNLNYLFKAMQELRNAFEEFVNKSLHDELKFLKKELSFSAGVCIAHYKEPLSMVLGKAAIAQKTAKHDKKGNRNAFSIIASKHSGENHETYFQWKTNCQNVLHLDRVKNELVTPKRFSNTFIQSLSLEFARLVDSQGHLSNRNLLEAEVNRLLKRSFMGKSDDKKSACEDFAKIIMEIYDEAETFENFINALSICDFMHRILNPDDAKSE